MKEERVVFLQSLYIGEEPFTTDEMIAKYSGVKRESVSRLIRKHKKDLEEFGIVGFEIRKPKKGTLGGHPQKVYQLNEEQATLLITYLDNTEPVRQFKRELVRQFYAIKNELFARRAERQAGKEIRRTMTDAIKEAGFSSHYYKHFTDLCYKSAIGFNASQIRKARGVSKRQNIMDYLTAEEQQAVQKRAQQITTLIDLSMDYERIKAILANGGIIYQTTLKLPAMAM